MPADGSMPIMFRLGFTAGISETTRGNPECPLLSAANDFLLRLNTYYRVTDHIWSLIKQS